MKKRNLFSLLVSWFALLAGGSALTAGSACGQQQQAIIRVTDGKSREPVSFAHVCFEGLINKTPHYALTSIEGTVVNPVKERSKLVISYVGYVSVNDTIEPGQSLEISMKPSILNMQEVVVTAQYAPEKADKSIYRVEVINRLQIESKAATNLGDLLKNETTMRVESNGVLGTSLRMQGLSGENIKILQDGIPMIGRMNGNFDLNQLNLNNVDHVEIVEGPMSVIYGSNALAGVINIITKENKSNAFSVNANTYAESVGQYNFDANVSANTNGHGIGLSGGRNFFGGYGYPNNLKETYGIDPFERDQDFAPKRQYFFDGYYSFSRKNLKIKFSGNYFNELLIDKGPLLPAYFETAFDAYFNTERYSGRADFNLNLPKQHYVNGVVSYSGYTRRKETYFVDLTTLSKTESINPEDRDTSGFHSIVARATYARNDSAKKFNYQTGIDINTEDGTGKRIEGKKQEIGDYAAFLSLKWDPWKKLSIQPGVRFIYNTKYDAPVVYALSLRAGPFSGAGVRFTYARGFRAPDIKQLYLNFKDINHDIQGNPDLNAETSHNLNLNLNYARETKSVAFSTDITGYFNAIDNVIMLASTGLGTTSYTYINIDKYQTTGFQAIGTVNIYPSIQIKGGVSSTGIRGSVGSDKMEGGFLFSTDETLNLSYRFVKQELTFSLYYKHSGKTPGILADSDKSEYYWVAPYDLMDFTLMKGFWSNRIRISGGVKNIFDVKFIPVTGATGGGHSSGGSSDIGWGRTYFIGLSFNFNKYK